MIDSSTVSMIASVVICTAGVIWRIAAAKNEIMETIYEMKIDVAKIEQKTENVTKDHDNLVIVESRANAAHRRLDELVKERRRHINE